MSLRAFQSVINSFVRTPHAQRPVRFYGRWTHRTPAKVLLPYESSPSTLKKENVIELDLKKSEVSSEKNKNITNKTINPKSPKPNGKHEQTKEEIEGPKAVEGWSSEQFKEIKEKKELRMKKMKMYLSQKKVFDEDNEIIYEKCKDNDGRISSLLIKLKSKRERVRSGMVLVEGWRLIVDGLEAKCPLKYIIFSRKEDLHFVRPHLPKTGVKIYKIPYKEIEMWSSVDTAPGIFGVFDLPTADNVKRLSRPFPLQLICDNIRTPGNLGAILRAAGGMGCDNVLLTKGCVDLWDPKVVRSAAGAHFRLPIHYGLDWDQLPKLVKDGSSVFIADSNDKEGGDTVLENKWDIPVIPYYGIEYSTLQSIALIIGGETEGISDESYSFAAKRNGLRLHIPLQKGMDSLNTGMATAVIAFEIKKQLLQAWMKAKVDRENKLLQGNLV